ncbi:toxin-antitoxin system YwqK family antitoxin [Salegentibacter chungangensis]|uniref:Toxin-antitoxin system YwqK family antitoxin n=1 Tax=Salegentibacter chungangensis TaxID=1335724 RepID=A0ABW3NL27_9FLAO
MNMMRTLLVVVTLILSGTAIAQNEAKEPGFEKQGDLIKATFYYENGNIRQEGTYKDGKLHGKWISYDEEGSKRAIAQYDHGKKTGKWFFWSGDTLREVTYENSRVASVNNRLIEGSRLSKQ